MGILVGRNFRLKIGDKTIYHATECTMNSTLKLDGIATKDTFGEVVTPDTISWTVSSKGLAAMLETGDTTRHDVSTLIDLHTTKSSMLMEFTSGTLNEITISGVVFIESWSLASPVEGKPTFDVNFKGVGVYTSTVND